MEVAENKGGKRVSDVEDDICRWRRTRGIWILNIHSFPNQSQVEQSQVVNVDTNESFFAEEHP
jgi:hypothetical protein